MPRIVSASVDDSLHSAHLLRVSEVHSNRLSHAASAIELRDSQYPRHATARTRKRRGRHSLRAASSIYLSDTSENSRKPVSNSDLSGSETRCLSLPASEDDGSYVPSPDHGSCEARSSYPSPPASEYSAPNTPPNDSCIADNLSPSLFPLTPIPLLTLSPATASDDRESRTQRVQGIGTVSGLRSPSSSPDRYIARRYTPQEPSKTFRLSKSPEQLSSTEKLLRHPSATPDPFSPLAVTRIRETRINTSANADPRVSQSRTRPIGTTIVQHPPQDPLATQNRQASAGSVWNVGGGFQASPSGPVRGISNGQGGFISSGSNAPMFTSHFFDDDTSELDNSQLESRLAVALEIDQTSRVLNIARDPVQTRSVSTGSIGIKRKYPHVEPRTRWVNNQWVQDSSRPRKTTLRVDCCLSAQLPALCNPSKCYHQLLYLTQRSICEAKVRNSKEVPKT